MFTRRSLLEGCGGHLSASILPVVSGAESPSNVIEIHMKSDLAGGVVGFDPVGVFVQPGQIVRWVCDANVHTTTAYSPKNDNHSLRIPENAEPWGSDFLMPGGSFEVKLTVEGMYDYYCVPHEMA
jgi:plastocyanin